MQKFVRIALVAAMALVVPAVGTAPSFAHDTSVKKISGQSSYYGKRFHGRKTANGERFNMNDMTAAHRSLPFGTKLKVTNRNNGRSVVVRVNDRGPYAGKRVLDLSQGAAQKIGMIRSGVARVDIEILG